ncbi:MAG TPA: PIN domain-containing protein [Candidatus Bathyarchaeia archaeon]
MTKGNVYDTRFLVEYFFSPDSATTRALKEHLRSTGEKLISAATIHEIHRLNLRKLDKETANLRSTLIRNEFKIIPIDYEIAVASAELSNEYRIPLADSVIAATALSAGCPLVSDDEHFEGIDGLKTRWPAPPNMDSKRP